MIRIRFFGPGELIQNGFRRASYNPEQDAGFFLKMVYVDTIHLAVFFIVHRSFGPHQRGPVRLCMFASFGINMVQTSSC